jgi:type II secretory pathway pseudopilin PulG
VIALRRRLRLDDSSEGGLTLVEVVVAMFVFAIIALGVAFSLVSTLHSAQDAKGRQVALNLASQNIDAARSVTDIFQLGTGVTTTTATVPGDSTVYTISREVQWVTSNGTDDTCGSGGGALQYKEVNVSVTWPGTNPAFPVRSDTIVSPATTVNDPSLGTIVVKVKNAAGAGVAGVTITTTPSTGTAISPTDADGCSYLLKIPPANYVVQASLSGYVDINQFVSPVYPVSPSTLAVTPGSTLSASFAYDKQGAVSATYASAGANIPKDLKTTFSSTIGGLYYSTAATAANPKPYSLYPASSYTVIAGAFALATSSSSGCLSVDPSQWPSGTASSGPNAGQNVASPPPVTVAFPPGQSPAIPVAVPMGLVSLKTGGSSVYISATAAPAPAGSSDPGCGTTAPVASPAVSFNFGPLTPVSGSILIALPFGSWSIKTGGSSGSLSPFTDITKILAPTGASGTSVSSSGVVTLDPRVVTP